MADELVTVATEFDYGDLDKKSVASLERHAAAIAEEQAGVRKRAAEGVIRVGRELAEAHDLLHGRGREGLFRPWVQQECDFTYQTAYRAIQAAETFGTEKCNTVLHLFDTTALYLLSSDSCPELATKEALRLARKGRRITKKLAEELRGKYTEPEEPEPAAPEQIEQDCDDVRETGEDGDQDDSQAEDAQDAAREPRGSAHEPEDPPAQDEPEAHTEEPGPDEDHSQDELPLPSPVSPTPSPPAKAASQTEVSVLGKLRSVVMGLAARTRDRANLVRSLRTIAVPEMIHGLAGALQGHAPPAVGTFLVTLAEEIEEYDA